MYIYIYIYRYIYIYIYIYVAAGGMGFVQREPQGVFCIDLKKLLKFSVVELQHSRSWNWSQGL